MDHIISLIPTTNIKNYALKKVGKVESAAGLFFGALGVAICMIGDRFGLGSKAARLSLGGTTAFFSVLLLGHGGLCTVSRQFISPTLPPEGKMKLVLNQLFQGTDYASYDTLPPYKHVLNQQHCKVNRSDMTTNVMKVVGASGRQLIAIKVTCTLTADNLQKLTKSTTPTSANNQIKSVLLLRQSKKGGLDWEQYLYDNTVAQPRYFTNSFTDSTTGELIEKQRENFTLLKTLLKEGKGKDCTDVVWEIS